MPTRYVYGTDNAETIYGANDHDPSIVYDEIFYGNGGADIIYAGGGNDWVWASSVDSSNVTFSGQDDNDVLVSFGGNDWLQGDAGADVLIAGSGNDTLFGATFAYAPSYYFNQPLNDSLWGGNGDDILYGFVGDDLLVGDIDGETGSDWLSGDGGRDTLIGGSGNDTLNGDDHNDQLWGRDGSDQLNGGDLPVGFTPLGYDILVGGGGADYLVGGLLDGSRDYYIGDAGQDEFTTSGGYWIHRGSNPTNTLRLTDIIWDFEPGADKIKVLSNDYGFGLEAAYTTTDLVDFNSGLNQGTIAGTLLYNGAMDHPVIFISGQNLTMADLTAASSLIFA